MAVFPRLTLQRLAHPIRRSSVRINAFVPEPLELPSSATRAFGRISSSGSKSTYAYRAWRETGEREMALVLIPNQNVNSGNERYEYIRELINLEA